MNENVNGITEFRNSNEKRGGTCTLVGGDRANPDASCADRKSFLARAMRGNGDGDQFVLEWTEEKSYVLPSWFSFATALIRARDKLLSMVDIQKGVDCIPQSKDQNIAAIVPFMMLLSGPPHATRANILF